MIKNNTSAKYYLNLFNTPKVPALIPTYANKRVINPSDSEEQKRYLHRVGKPDLNEKFQERFAGFAIPNFFLDMIEESEARNQIQKPYPDLNEEELSSIVKGKDLISIPHSHELNHIQQINKIIDTVAEANLGKEIVLAFECTNLQDDSDVEFTQKLGLLKAHLDLDLLKDDQKKTAQETFAVLEPSMHETDRYMLEIFSTAYKNQKQGKKVVPYHIDKADKYLNSSNAIKENRKISSEIFEVLNEKNAKDLKYENLSKILNELVENNMSYYDYQIKHRNVLQLLDVSSVRKQEPESIIIYLLGSGHRDTLAILNELNGQDKSVIIPVEHPDDSGKLFSANQKDLDEIATSKNKLQNLYQSIYRKKYPNEILSEENSSSQWELFKTELKNNLESAEASKNVMEIIKETLTQVIQEITKNKR